MATRSKERTGGLSARRIARHAIPDRTRCARCDARGHKSRRPPCVLEELRVLRPRGAAFVGHREESNNTERPTIFRDQRSRIGVKYVCLFERGTPGAHWGQTRYLDVGSSRGRAITIRFKLEFDFVDTSSRRIHSSIKRKIDRYEAAAADYDTSFRNVWTGALSDVLESDLNRRSSDPHRQGDPHVRRRSPYHHR
jgi:hypothetical protein